MSIELAMYLIDDPTGKFYNGEGVKFDGSILQLDFKYSDEHDIDGRAQAIQEQLENNL